MDPIALETFFRLHAGLPKQGPGSNATTREALQRIGPYHPAPRVLDMGCGPGRQTLVLARETGGYVTAVDTHRPFLDELEEAANAAGLGPQVRVQERSMDEVDPAEGLYDLIWSEGAIYNIGFDRGLELWRPLLAEAGALAVTELSWLTTGAPEEVRDFFGQHYPAMRSAEDNAAAFGRFGYDLVDHFVLPESDWFEGYYDELEARLDRLEKEHLPDPAREVLAESRAEINLFRLRKGSYGYVFYLARAAE